MKKMTVLLRKSFLTLAVLVLLLLLLLPVIGSAMSSTSYRLDWFNPMTGSGGASSSTHYRINLTVGQTVSGSVSSTHYGMNLGYWQNYTQPIFLPLVVRP